MRLALLPVMLLLVTSSGLAAERSYGDENPPVERFGKAEISDPGRFGLLRLDSMAGDDIGDVCYMLRTYKVEREEENSDATRIVAEYKCQHASKFTMKKAKPRELPER